LLQSERERARARQEVDLHAHVYFTVNICCDDESTPYYYFSSAFALNRMISEDDLDTHTCVG